MLARNPKTGGNIRIINLDTSVWRDQKTIVWFDKPVEGNWERWDIGVTDTNVAEQVKAGKMRALAISADKPIPGIDVPTLKDNGIDTSGL
jgi:hypothetical protein